jgi:succinate dehydrogenase / fumarate reductase flavoprotein subunit
MVDVLVIGASRNGLTSAISAKTDENIVLVVTKDFNKRTNAKHNLFSLQLEALNNNVKFQTEYFLLNFMIDDNQILGATFIDIKTSLVKIIEAKSIIIASGGYSSIYYNFNTNKNLDSGDVIASAVRIGAKFKNAQYVKFRAITDKSNPSVMFPNNQNIKDFDGYDIKVKNNLARHIYENSAKCYGIFANINNEDVEIIPSAEYCLGGIETKNNGESEVKGLFVVGESASDNVDLNTYSHEDEIPNKNNSIKEISINASKYASIWESKNIDISKHPQILRDKQFVDACFLFCNKIDFKTEREFLGDLLYKKASFRKTKNTAKEILEQIKKLKYNYTYMGLNNKTRSYNEDLIELIEFGNIIEISEMIILSFMIKDEKNILNEINEINSPNETDKINTTIWKINKKNIFKNMAIFDYKILTKLS